MVVCSAVGCYNSDRQGYTMKYFPKEPKKRLQWIKELNRNDWYPDNRSLLCEVHFEKSMWENSNVKGKRKLKPNAIPTIFHKNLPDKMNIEHFGTDNEHTYSYVKKITTSPRLLMRRLILHEKRYRKLLNSNRYYRNVNRLLNRKLQRLETTNNTERSTLLRSIFNDDQIEALKQRNKRFVTKWSGGTLTRAVKLRFACGKEGYQELLAQRIPLPSLQTLKKHIDDLSDRATVRYDECKQEPGGNEGTTSGNRFEKIVESLHLEEVNRNDEACTAVTAMLKSEDDKTS